MLRGLLCAAIAWAHTHPAEGLMRRLVDASRVRVPVPVRSQPRWSRRIPTRIAHGIGHGHARVFMDSIGNKAVIPSWRTPHRMPRIPHPLASQPAGGPNCFPSRCGRRGRRAPRRFTRRPWRDRLADIDAAVSAQRCHLPASWAAPWVISRDRLTVRMNRARGRLNSAGSA